MHWNTGRGPLVNRMVLHFKVEHFLLLHLSFPKMANLAAAVVAAAGRDPAVDRSLRSVFGKFIDGGILVDSKVYVEEYVCTHS